MFTFFHNPFIAILKGAGPPGAPRGHFTLHRARDVTQLRGTRSRSLAEPNVYWLWCYNANTRIKTLQQDSHMSTTHDGQLALCKGRKQQMATLNTLWRILIPCCITAKEKQEKTGIFWDFSIIWMHIPNPMCLLNIWTNLVKFPIINNLKYVI